MKVDTPQILWIPEGDKGLNAALMSVDLVESGLVDPTARHHDNSNCSHVLATAGNSNDINLWKMMTSSTNTNHETSSSGNGNTPSSPSAPVVYLTSLSRHEGPVNCVSFSPDGLHLATAGDTGTLIIWSVPLHSRGNANGRHFWATCLHREADLQVQIVTRTAEGLTDLAWSSDSRRLVAGSIDHTVLVVEDVNYAYSTTTTNANHNNNNSIPKAASWKVVYRNGMDHTHFVQGVAYDPQGVYIASASSDRSVRIFPRKLPLSILSSNKKKKKQILRQVQQQQSQSQSLASPPSQAVPPAHVQQQQQQLLADTKFDLAKSKLIKFRRISYLETTTTTAAAAAASTTTTSPPESSGTAANMTTTTTNTNVLVKRQHMFADEPTLQSFVRRLAWTCDGAYLLCPGGLYHHPTCTNDNATGGGTGNNNNNATSSNPNNTAAVYGTYMFARHHYDEPYKVLHGLEKPSVAVCPNPILFELPKKKHNATGDMEQQSTTTTEGATTTTTSQGENVQVLPYRSIFAVLTWDSVILYDTVQDTPLSIIKNLHYANLSSATWSRDGHTLVVSSTDGYLSIVQFATGELGTVYSNPQVGVVGDNNNTDSVMSDANNKSIATNGSVMNKVVTPPARRLPLASSQKLLPPCEPGRAHVEAPPTKKAKTRVAPTLISTTCSSSGPGKTGTALATGGENSCSPADNTHKRPLEQQEPQTVTAAVDQLTIQPSKKKKRIQPILVSASAK